MSFNLKEIVFMALLVVASSAIVRYLAPEKIVYSTGEQQEQLDSLTVLSRNLRISKSQLQDSLKETSQAFQEYVDKAEDEMASYSRITGRLKLEVDSLEQVAASASLADLVDTDSTSGHQFRDTTLTSRSMWGDSLIGAEARAGIRNDSLFLDPPIVRQLRRVRIDVATFVAGDHSRVNTLVTSPDFDSLRVESFTPLEKKRRFPWTEIVAVGSFLLGYAL